MRWGWHKGDHYEWLTAYLAARDLQPATSRVVAGIIAGLGVGMQSTALPIVAIGAGILVAYHFLLVFLHFSFLNF